MSEYILWLKSKLVFFENYFGTGLAIKIFYVYETLPFFAGNMYRHE